MNLIFFMMLPCVFATSPIATKRPPVIVCKDPNEIITKCYTPCADRKCIDRIKGSNTVCIAACIETGCVCKPNYYRHDNNTCVPILECSPPRCDKSEEYKTCGSACPDTCDNKGDTCKFCTKQCVEGCFCKNGTVRSENGSCIDPKKCPEPKCHGPNEYFDWCPPNCPHQNCSAIWSKFDCSDAPTCCKPQCRCIDGYYRNNGGVCISSKNCTTESSCPPNSWYNQCGTSCPLTCDEPNPRPCNRKCNPGCQCDDGYIKDKDGNCIKPEDCPKKVVCKDPNEILTDCYTVCADKTCKDRIKGSDRVCHTACIETGCICKEDYYRHDNGTCVSVDQCSPPRCNDDEEYQQCGTACPETCNNRGDTCRVCTAQCVDGCFCKNNTVRADNGSCIAPKECPEPECKGPNEHFDWCPPNCPHQSCSIIWSRISCVNASKCCKPQCRCIDGHFRNGSGICVTGKECSSKNETKCGPHSSFNSCGTACPLTCDEPNPRPCTKQCNPACQCDDGYIQDKDGNCIKPEECPQAQCGANQTYVQCKFSCPTDYCKESNGPDPQCLPPHPCPPGCRCKPGYLKRQEDGECINKTDCPSPVICEEGEHFERCGTACPPRCDNLNPQVCTEQCVKGCFCNQGLVRDHITGKCIPPEKCPAESVCGKNEHFEECGTACPPTCNNPNPQICTFQCVRGCFCDKGLLRDEKSGKCVPPKECPPRTCRDDEVYKECGSACPETCDNRNNTCLACIAVCVEGCFCKDGLVRAANGTCIPPKQCPQPVCTGQNEHFDWCPPNCPHQNCSAIWSRIDCRNASDCCKPQCRCIDGYYRNDSGICISVNECIHGSNCGPNSRFNDCGSACPLTCEEPEPRPCTRQCVAGCVCEDGFVKDKDGNCIKPNECPKSQCGANQSYVQCQFDCPTDYCKESNAPVPVCSPPYPCPPGCRCNSGYLKRRVDGECVKETDCPPPVVCEEGEHFERCGTACPKRCDNLKPQICTEQCVTGCFCDQGLVRDQISGKCIPPEKCPVETDCGKNEHFEDCGTACPPTCDNPNPQICTDQCVRGCFCDKGLLRDEKSGKCVPPKECPPKVCPKNEEWLDCGSACPLTCDNMNKSLVCPAVCKEGCFCKKGLVRNADGVCVPPEQCPRKICPKNEEWRDCGSACPLTCDNMNKSLVCPAVCKEGCFCKKGLVRNADGVCVPPEQCPPRCKANEVYSNCSIVCPPQTCASKYTLYRCQSNLICKPGCNCIKGYLRNGTVDDPCIPSDKCPPLKPICPKNEEWNSCGTACPKTCKNKDLKIKCIAVCKEGCFCKDGLVRNDKGVCVNPKQCPSPVCPKNEEWNSCGTACPKTCKNKDLKIKCIAVCKKGCFCKDGLVRNDKGVCVNPKQCPPTCKANEVYSNCSIVCPPQTCASVYTTYLCDKNATCKPGCNCVDGYLRNGTANDPCIPSDKCPPPSPVCPENEEWNSCGTACPKTCKNKDLKINCIAVCKEGCFCKDGLVRNDKGVCVDPKQCCNETNPTERRRLIG